ncbi:MAG TPA: EamA family transporter [Ruminococcaceae bacterium]|nr:EamA family transporter [Oscillospiraceae bacterium]
MNRQILQKKPIVFLGATVCCALWGSAFPCVKIGMQLLGISSSDTANQILFGGIRFTLAGLLILLIGSLSERKPLIPNKNQLKKIAKLSVFQTVGQYAFYYIGVARSTGVNSSIVNSLAHFFAILAACLVFRTEKLTSRKVMGCLLGFLGVILVNLTGGRFQFNMTFLGEGMVLLAALFYAISSVLSKIYAKDDHPVLLCGGQFVLGGIVLSLGGFAVGGRIHFTSAKAVLILFYLALISTVAYTLWTILLKYNDVSSVSIYGFLNPIFGVLLSILFLHETQAVRINYFIALLIVCIGIALVNFNRTNKHKKLGRNG